MSRDLDPRETKKITVSQYLRQVDIFSLVQVLEDVIITGKLLRRTAELNSTRLR